MAEGSLKCQPGLDTFDWHCEPVLWDLLRATVWMLP